MGFALNFVAVSKLNGSLLFGVTGWHVKYEPTTCVCWSFPCPRSMVGVHSFIARMPRGKRSLSTYGARCLSVVGSRSEAASAPCDFLGKKRVVTQPACVNIAMRRFGAAAACAF